MYLYHFHSSSSTMYSTILCCGFLIVSAKVSSRKSLSLFDVVSAAWGMKNIRMPAALYCFYLLVIITKLWKYIPAHKIYNKYLIKIKFCHSFCFLIGKVVFKNSYFYFWWQTISNFNLKSNMKFSLSNTVAKAGSHF